MEPEMWRYQENLVETKACALICFTVYVDVMYVVN